MSDPKPPGRPRTIGADTAVVMRQPKALVEAVKAAAKARGVSAAQVWREALTAWLERQTPAIRWKP